MSACRAVSRPPPMQKPRIMAMTGFSRLPQERSRAACPLSYSARAAGEVRCSANSEMSAPEAKALSPAPVRTTTRTSLSAWSAPSRPASAARIPLDTALRLPGLLKVTTATRPVTSTSSLSVPVSCRAGELDDVMQVLSDHSAQGHVRARQHRQADRVRVLLQCGRHDLLGRLVQPGADDLDPGIAQGSCHHLRAAGRGRRGQVWRSPPGCCPFPTSRPHAPALHRRAGRLCLSRSVTAAAAKQSPGSCPASPRPTTATITTGPRSRCRPRTSSWA